MPSSARQEFHAPFGSSQQKEIRATCGRILTFNSELICSVVTFGQNKFDQSVKGKGGHALLRHILLKAPCVTDTAIQ